MEWFPRSQERDLGQPESSFSSSPYSQNSQDGGRNCLKKPTAGDIHVAGYYIFRL